MSAGIHSSLVNRHTQPDHATQTGVTLSKAMDHDRGAKKAEALDGGKISIVLLTVHVVDFVCVSSMVVGMVVEGERGRWWCFFVFILSSKLSARERTFQQAF